MSIKVMNLVWHSTLEGSSKRFVLLALADSANDQGRVLKLGVPTLCRKTGIKRSAMFTVLKQLEEVDQLIQREERTGTAGERRTSRFWINLPALRAMQLPDDDGQADLDEPSNPFVSAGQTPVQEMDGGYPQGVQIPDRPPSKFRTGPVHLPDGPGVQIPDGPRPPTRPLSPSLCSEKNSVPSEPDPDDGRTDGDFPSKISNGYTNAAELLVRTVDLTAVDPRPRQVQQIRACVARVLAEGYPATAVDQYLRAKVKEARTVTYLLGAFEPERLPDVAHYAKPPAAQPPAACDDCLRNYPAARVNIRLRHRDGKPCPACHPDALLASTGASK